MRTISLFALLALACAVTAQVTVLTARMSGKNNVNGTVLQDTGSPYSGVFVAFYDASVTNSPINYFILHNIPTVNVTAAHIHGNATTTSNAGVIFNVTNAAGNQYYTGTWTDTNGAQKANLMSGLTYFNIHTVAFPGGEIRGQIYPGNISGVTHIALLDFQSQNVFSINPSVAKGLGLFSLNSSNILTATVQHQIAAPTVSHIHGNATFCNNAGVAYLYTSPVNEINQAFQYTADTLSALANLQQYVNIHTTAFPNGEIRGQIIPVSYYEAPNNRNTFQLSGCPGTQAPTTTAGPTSTASPTGTTTAAPATTKASSATTIAVSALTVAVALAMF